MLSPKKPKYRKQMKNVHHLNGRENRGCDFASGDFGLRAMEPGWISAKQIEAARVAATRHIKRGGRLLVKIFPDKPLSKKAAETRMGSGKGAPEEWVAVVRPGRLIFELTGVDKKLASEALTRASSKLPLKTKFVARSEYIL